MTTEIIKKGSILEGDDLQQEYRDRKRPGMEMSIPKTDPIPDGWEIKREFKTRRRIWKEKNVGIQLEDKVWCLFYELGIPRLSSRRFTLLLKTRGAVQKTKEIDVVAIDDDVVFLVQCKSQEKSGKKSLKKEIAEFAGDANDIRNSLRRLLASRKQQFQFVFATENIEWFQNDKLDAKDSRILTWDEYDLLALQDLASLAGEGAKYQLYTRIFYGKKIKGFDIKVPSLKAKMGGHTYYSFVLPPEHLLKISYVHQRSAECSFLELADSYQRMIDKRRVRRIEQYISGGGFFPGSIILNFTRRFPNEEVLGEKRRLNRLRGGAKPVVITLPPYYGCAWIIDGQHRLYGYSDTPEKRTETVSVVAFLEEPSHVQAKMFVDTNKNQKAIGANLLWDLYEDLFSEAQDEKEQQLFAISKTAKSLNSCKKSPFCRHIAIPKEKNKGNISLNTICTSIRQQKLIAKGEKLLYRQSYEASIGYAADRIACYFEVLRQALPEEWEKADDHYVRTNSGVVVLMGILRDIIECCSPKELDDIDRFRKRVDKMLYPLLVHLADATPDELHLWRGAGGASQRSRQVRAHFTKIMRDAGVGFWSRWFEKYEQALKEEDKLQKKRKGIKYYLDKDEDELLEFKGSVSADLDRYFKGDGRIKKRDDIADEGVMKTIVGFLNTKGGQILVGVLEKHRFRGASDEKLADCPSYGDKLIIGLEIEYKKDEWDGYQQRLWSYIEDRIGPEVIDGELVLIQKDRYEDKDLCLITVSPSESKQYLRNKFFVRRGNKTVCLEGHEIDRYWSRRQR